MRQCIICREDKESFNDEHVIPDALGGYYHIRTVCKSCNSSLGSFVDSKLVNHKFSEFQRYVLGLKGKSRKIPNPFSGVHHIVGDKSKKIQLRLGKDRSPIPYTVTSVEYEDLLGDPGGTKVKICLDATDEKKLDTILTNIAKKLKVPKEHLNISKGANEQIERPSINCTLSIDLTEFKIGLLKIAYEFATDTIPEYFSDESAVEISKVLYTANSKSVEKYVSIGNGFDHSIFDPIRNYIDLKNKNHYLTLTNTSAHGLLCLIHLHGMFSAGVILSTKPYPNTPLIIGINSIEGKTFRKIYPHDLLAEIYAPPELEFQYHFHTEHSLNTFLTAEKSENFKFCLVGDSFPIFDKMGRQLDTDLYGKMKEMEKNVISEALEKGEITHTFLLNEEIFIKILPSQQLVQIIAVRERWHQIRKL